jgi:hypothetical protein
MNDQELLKAILKELETLNADRKVEKERYDELRASLDDFFAFFKNFTKSLNLSLKNLLYKM